MDFLNKAKTQFQSMNTNNNTGSSTANAGTTNPAAGQPQGGAAPAEKEDYGDKGLDFLQKKTGHTFSREQNEQITDGARGAYEKFTGSKVDPKYSN